ncbi:MAG: 50S ribosomal protein L3 [Candidatus Cloacimonas sp.]|jgi:large subunit ribosomal protein L3|nr:50S ribosomal protein L3 [Candidatus Cloacimonadota bacterium]
MIGLIGKKIGMTQHFDEDGKVTPVTVLKVGPCKVVQRKTVAKDGYDAIQLGFEEIEERKLTKPKLGHFKKYESKPYRHLREFTLEFYRDIDQGEDLDVSMFVENELVKVTGTSKGKGFAGVMKRHNFRGSVASHGSHESFRGTGSIGQSATPARVMKGKKMPGQMGNERVTVSNLRVISIDAEKGIMLIKGAVPGHRNSIVYVSKSL